jgi:hypothetical protein
MRTFMNEDVTFCWLQVEPCKVWIQQRDTWQQMWIMSSCRHNKGKCTGIMTQQCANANSRTEGRVKSVSKHNWPPSHVQLTAISVTILFQSDVYVYLKTLWQCVGYRSRCYKFDQKEFIFLIKYPHTCENHTLSCEPCWVLKTRTAFLFSTDIKKCSVFAERHQSVFPRRFLPNPFVLHTRERQ